MDERRLAPILPILKALVKNKDACGMRLGGGLESTF